LTLLTRYSGGREAQYPPGRYRGDDNGRSLVPGLWFLVPGPWHCQSSGPAMPARFRQGAWRCYRARGWRCSLSAWIGAHGLRNQPKARSV